MASAEEVEPVPFVSTGSLTSPERVQQLLQDAHERSRLDARGTVSQVYPLWLQWIPRFGLSVVSPAARVFSVGDACLPFAVMSVVKPSTFALLSEDVGAERAAGRRPTPMIDAGAIVDRRSLVRWLTG